MVAILSSGRFRGQKKNTFSYKWFSMWRFTPIKKAALILWHTHDSLLGLDIRPELQCLELSPVLLAKMSLPSNSILPFAKYNEGWIMWCKEIWPLKSTFLTKKNKFLILQVKHSLSRTTPVTLWGRNLNDMEKIW